MWQDSSTPYDRAEAMRASTTTQTLASSGIGFGSALAITISWSTWHSILWAIVHGACSWLYVIYYWWNQP